MTHRVLVARELEPFVDAVDVPDDLEIEWLSASDVTPSGSHHGILPLLSRRIDRPVLERLPELRVIANYAVGYDNVDLAAARAHDVAVSNTPDVLTEATADLCWALILATCRRLPEAERLARGGEWQGWHPTLLLGQELRGRQLGILGAGRIGRAVGRRAVPFGLRIAYWSRTRRPDWEKEVGADRHGSLDSLLSSSDIVSVHLPLTEETSAIIGREALELMGPDGVLINTARGAIVDTEALCEALESDRLFGAGLDVYAEEPRIPDRLRQFENVVMLPHIGSATERARRQMFEIAWENLLRGVRGAPLVTPVEADA